MKSRKERRLEARLNGVKFEPQYNGNSPVSYEEYSGIGNERFNNKFVMIKQIVVDEVVDGTGVIGSKRAGLFARAKGLLRKGSR